ncbi:TPA: hypothetical protein ACU2BT_000500 [Staphylococcus aureus]
MNKINKILLPFFILVLTISVTTLPISQTRIANAQNSNLPSKEEINKTASIIKFIYEEASTKDGNGNIIDIDVQKIEKKYHNSKELESLKEEINTIKSTLTPRSFSDKKFMSCIKSAVADQFGVGVVKSIMEGGFYTYMKKKAYKEATKLILKFAIGSNIIGLSAFVAYYDGKCAAHANS